MREIKRQIIPALLALTFALAGTAVLAHWTASSTIANCDGGVTYADALPLAKGALVGRVISTRQGHFGIVFVSAIHVEHAWGRRLGEIYRGSMTDGWCADEILPRAGAHMVVLLGVSVQPGGPALDLFYTIGRTVTETQATHIGDTLPVTATAAPSVPGRHNEPPLGLFLVSGGLSFVAVLALLSRRKSAVPGAPSGGH